VKLSDKKISKTNNSFACHHSNKTINVSSLQIIGTSCVLNGRTTTEELTNDRELPEENRESTEKNGEYFLRLVAAEADRLNTRCLATEQYLRDGLTESVCGRMRAAIGKANLLTTKKFRQFKELCQNNLTESDDLQFRTTSEDLAGFWDMVLIQVNDVHGMFDEITLLSQCEWDETKLCSMNGSTNGLDALNNHDVETTKNSPSVSKSSKTTTRTPAKTSKTAASSTSAKREEAKKRLMAAKLAGRERKASNSDDGIQIFVS